MRMTIMMGRGFQKHARPNDAKPARPYLPPPYYIGSLAPNKHGPAPTPLLAEHHQKAAFFRAPPICQIAFF